MATPEEQAQASADAVLSFALRRVCRSGQTCDPIEIAWPLMLERAQALNLLPLLAAALPDLPRPVPPAVQTTLQTAARRQRIRNLVLGDAFGELARRFAAASIDFLPLKGIALAHTAYPSPTLRYFDDLDVLVRPEQLAAAASLLYEAGYQTHPRAEKADWHHWPPLVHPQHGATVELHVDLFRRAGHERWPLAAVWQRAVPATVAGVACRVLEPADALVLTALHARHGLFEKATWLLDSTLLLAQCADVGRLAARAQVAGALAPLAHLLEIDRRLGLIAAVPPLAATWLPRSAARRVRNWEHFTPLSPALRSGALPKVVEIVLMDDGRGRRAQVRALLRPPGTLVQAGYASPWQRLRQRGLLVLAQGLALLKRPRS